MQKDPGDEQAYKKAFKAAKSLRQVVSKNPDALKYIFGKESTEGKNEAIIKHSLNVCAVATKLAESKGCSEEELDNLAVASLIHDIGITMMPEVDQAIFNKLRSDFSPDDIRAYNDHSRASKKALEDKPFVNKEILNLVAHHEETKSGEGPHKHTKLTLLEEILSLANRYDKRVMLSGEPPKDVIKGMIIDELGNYDLDLIQALQSILKEDGLLE